MNILTIGMPVFNDIEFIEASLNSILNQDRQDFRLIISDDGSSDGSEAVCRKYAATDSRIEYVRQPKNLGISKNMEFLLAQADTPYFMWAADDDLWSTDFASILIGLLEKDKSAVSAFGKYDLIDENGGMVQAERNYDFKASDPKSRLKKLIRNPDDGFGYGIFRTSEIKDVKFPIWKWPNRSSAYNNIYPSLCFYLAKGPYLHYNDRSIFFKRVKSANYVNHVLSGEGNAVKETFAYIMRRLNLVCFSTSLMMKTNNKRAVFSIFPLLVYRWFIISSASQLRLAGSSFWKNRVIRKR